MQWTQTHLGESLTTIRGKVNCQTRASRGILKKAGQAEQKNASVKLADGGSLNWDFWDLRMADGAEITTYGPQIYLWKTTGLESFRGSLGHGGRAAGVLRENQSIVFSKCSLHINITR
jgi:hypothetical protein